MGSSRFLARLGTLRYACGTVSPARPVSRRSGVSAERRPLRAKPAPMQPPSSPFGTLAARSPVRLPVRFKTPPTPCKHWLGTLARFKTPPVPPQAQVLQAVGDDVRSRRADSQAKPDPPRRSSVRSRPPIRSPNSRSLTVRRFARSRPLSAARGSHIQKREQPRVAASSREQPRAIPAPLRLPCNFRLH